jgi:NO-binding membrane sensor protein with MHYT domain
MIDFGYLALMLAILQPWIAFSEGTKKDLAWIFLAGTGLLPVGVFLIHYVGLAYSPLQTIGWASIFADLGGLLVLVATLGLLLGLGKYFRSQLSAAVQDTLLLDHSAPGPLLLAGGMVLMLTGFLHGAYYAALISIVTKRLILPFSRIWRRQQPQTMRSWLTGPWKPMASFKAIRS